MTKQKQDCKVPAIASHRGRKDRFEAEKQKIDNQPTQDVIMWSKQLANDQNSKSCSSVCMRTVRINDCLPFPRYHHPFLFFTHNETDS